MLQVEMSASVRATSGKGAMRRLRSEGITPAVVYGAGAEAQQLQLETKPLTASLLQIARKNAVVTLNIEGGDSKSVVVKEVQTDPITDGVLHADFCEIDLDKSHVFTVPVTFEGAAKGVDLGGKLVVSKSVIELQGKPLDVPETLTVDVTELNIGDQFKCSKIELPANIEMVTDSEASLVGVEK